MLNIFNEFIARFSEQTDKEDKNGTGTGKATPIEKIKRKEIIARYGSFYLRLGAIGTSIHNIHIY